MKKIINADHVSKFLYDSEGGRGTLINLLQIIDTYWGKDRNADVSGGYALVIENKEDIAYLSTLNIDLSADTPELVYHIKEDDVSKSFISVFIPNPDFHFIVLTPSALTPQNIISQVTDIVDNSSSNGEATNEI